MKYEEKVHEILELAGHADSQEDGERLAALEHSLATAQFYRSHDLAKAHKILDKARWGYE